MNVMPFMKWRKVAAVFSLLSMLIACGSLAIEDQTRGAGRGEDGEVLAMLDGLDKSLDRIPAPASTLVHLKVRSALIVATIEILDLGYACLARRITECVQNLPGQTLLFYSPLATGAMHVTGTGVIVLHGLEYRQHIIPAPAFIACVTPAVVILALATHVDHAVNRGTPPHDLAARIAKLTAI